MVSDLATRERLAAAAEGSVRAEGLNPSVRARELVAEMVKGDRIESLKKGETFIVHQIAGKRLLIEQDDGTYGYVDMSKCNVDLRKEYHLPFITVREAKVFGQPKENRGSLLFTLPEESGVTLTGFRGEWARILYGEEVGYTPYKNLAYTG